MYKDCNVVMLPTNEKETCNIFKDITTKKLGYKPNNVRMFEHEDYIAQHLYITSSEKIKEGDWIYNVCSKTHVQFTKDFIEYYSAMDSDFPIKSYRKIIATTDSSLKITKSVTGYTEDRSRTFYHDFPLPHLSEQFINDYIKEYNKDNVITKVEVDYEECGTIDSTCGLVPHIDSEGQTFYMGAKLKVNPDNTINIKPIKDSWSREEVESLIREWASFTVTGRGQWWKPNDLDNWIKENL